MQDPDANKDLDLEAEPSPEDASGNGSRLEFLIDAPHDGQRLDVAVTDLARKRPESLSRTRVKRMIETGRLRLGDVRITDPNAKVEAGQRITLHVPPAEDIAPRGEAMPLIVVYEDDHLIVIDKPAGLVVHPAPGHASGTLVNALIAHCGQSLSGVGGVRRPGIVHRLDKDTSGLLVVAKTDAAHHGLAALFADHGRDLLLVRTYLAFLWGAPARASGTVETFIGRHPTDRLRMAVVPERHGRRATTHWRLEERFGPAGSPLASRVACHLETGRTHQIRVHMTRVGHPVIGDPLYARGFRTKASKLSGSAQACLAAFGRQALHAAVLVFEHPVTGESLEFESALPPDLAALECLLKGAS